MNFPQVTIPHLAIIQYAVNHLNHVPIGGLYNFARAFEPQDPNFDTRHKQEYEEAKQIYNQYQAGTKT